MRIRAAAIAVLVAASAASSASAAPWKRVTTPDGASTDQVGLARTGDGLDAGQAVKGARVRAGGKSGTTDGKGRVTLSLKSRRPVRARATHAGYTAAAKRLAVRR